ncbi:hypothetical protein HY031_01455 [Candidatus Gottesmanbacteria bacterium]|nr:hypothetical protein [Candidatus Gottesmanbacteria bacterium]
MKRISPTLSGFTLIELIVSIGILLLLIGGLLAGYNNYNQGQEVKQSALTLKANLRLAQTWALSALKPTSGCTQLTGYTVTFTATTYGLQAQCDPEGLVGSTTAVTIPTGVSFVPVPQQTTFGVLTQGLISPGSTLTITLSGFNKNYQLVVSPSGDITDNGFQ